MKKMKYLLIMVMAVMISVSCSDDDDDDVNPIVGTWEFTETFDGEVIDIEVTFMENLTGTLLVTYTYQGEIEIDESENFTWSTSGNKLTMVIDGETDISTYLIVGNKLTITSDGDVTILTRQ
jgi:hypothetical protein